MNKIHEYLKKILGKEVDVNEANAKKLRDFYFYYNYDKIKSILEYNDKLSVVKQSIKNNPFTCIINMNNGVLSMKIEAQHPVTMDFLLYVGYYFDKYSRSDNCVWTKKETLIRKLFETGLIKYKQLGGNIKLNLDSSIPSLINMLLEKTLICDKQVDSGVVNKLCADYQKLKHMSWTKYFDKTYDEYKEEQNRARVEEITCMDLPLDWDNLFSNSEESKGVYAESSGDGLIKSLNNLGRVDIEYIAEITGLTYKDVIQDLKGAIYQNPETWNECFYKGWELKDEYLSGRVIEKLRIAKEADKKYLGYFADNVKALEEVKMPFVGTDDIHVTIGSPWVPTDIIDSFIYYLFGDWMKNYSHTIDRTIFNTRYDETSGTWEIPHKNRYWRNIANDTVYGTPRINGITILEKTLNMKNLAISDTVTKNGKKVAKLNKSETLLAREKQGKIIKAFQNWIWKDPNRKERLVRIYEEKYCSNIIRHYDGSFLQFPEMNKDVELYNYQKNAVARIMFSPNTLLAHDVGAGKTYVMIAAGMEMRRTGLSKKNLYVVPNNLVGQWKSIFMNLYPDSNILCIEPKSFTPAKRLNVLKNIRDCEYDAIIITYSSFDLIAISKRFYCDKMQEQIDILNKRIKKLSSKDNVKKRDKLIEKLDKLKEELEENENLIYFDELGINTLFIDEAHNFKNLPIESKIDRVLGVSLTGSKKCESMLDKVHIVQRQNNGRGVVLATGTPITNSLSDMFVMQKYLQAGELALLNIQSFDSWVGMFAEKEANFEIDVDTKNYRMATRFSNYHNMPELSTILASVTDFYQIDRTTGIPELDGYTDVIVKKTKEFQSYLNEISIRADRIRDGRMSRKEDNMLKITTDGRKAALDIRLVDKKVGFSFDLKVAHCAEKVYKIYHETKQDKSTQLIFCDTSTPKKGFNIYDELKKLLVTMGIPANQIAYIHDAVTDAERDELFEMVQKGLIRILIGSTMKLGLGVNVQDKLVALHHLDVPWRPSDMIQREGRILRRGNENDKVQIFRYITEGSFDAYSWQILESKQRMIRALLSGSMPKRKCEEVDETVLNYAEVKAIAVGNPLIKKRVETANELAKHQTLQRKLVETRQLLEVELAELPNKINDIKDKIELLKADIEFYNTNKVKYTVDERNDFRKTIASVVYSDEVFVNPQTVCEYQGFEIIVPNNMLKDKPYIFIQKNGKYYLELGTSEIGMMIRIDNFLDDLDNLLTKQELALERMEKRIVDVSAELEKGESYVDKIIELEAELEKLDKKLGVKK